MIASSLWFKGVCDSMLGKVLYWQKAWPGGKPYASRQRIELDATTTDVVTMRDVKVSWTRAEFEHLVRILTALRPKWEITADMANALKNFDRGQMLGNGQRLVSMRGYQEDPQEILAVLLEAKTGKKTFEQEAAEALKRGESLF